MRRQIGEQLAASFPGASRQPLKALDARAMEMASGDRELRAALFRFVDVVPACRSLDDLARHLIGFLEEVPETPPPLSVAMKMSGTRAGRAALGAAAAGGVRHLAHRFIVGETPDAALGTLRKLWERGVASSVDLLGEATVTESEADRYAARCLEAIEQLSAATRGWPARAMLETDGAGALPRANVCVKVSALTPLLRPDAPERGQRDAARRLRPLLRAADSAGAHLHIDMESLDSREAVLDLVLDLLDEDEFRDGPSAGLVLQAYLRDSPDQARRVIAWARRDPARAPADGAAGQGRLLGPRAGPGQPARLGGPGVPGQARVRSQLRGAHPRAAGRPPGAAGGGGLAQPALGGPRDRLQPRGRRR